MYFLKHSAPRHSTGREAGLRHLQFMCWLSAPVQGAVNSGWVSGLAGYVTLGQHFPFRAVSSSRPHRTLRVLREPSGTKRAHEHTQLVQCASSTNTAHLCDQKIKDWNVPKTVKTSRSFSSSLHSTNAYFLHLLVRCVSLKKLLIKSRFSLQVHES